MAMLKYALAAIILLLSGPYAADAATLTFSGSGNVESTLGKLTPTGAAPLGSPVIFSFTFDTDLASLTYAEDAYALYDLPVSSFTATIGNYNFTLANPSDLNTVVELSRGFSFFDGPNFEPSLGIAFYLPGAVLNSATNATPFSLSAGSGDTLSFGAVFKADPDDSSVGLDALRNPADANVRFFNYSAYDSASGKSGVLSGTYMGGFAVGSVPEPASWGLMIVGLGGIGAAMRRRRAILVGSEIIPPLSGLATS